MPVVRTSDALPHWCELEHFEIVRLQEGQSYMCPALGPRQKLIVGAGRCTIRVDGEPVQAAEGTNLDLGQGTFQVRDVVEPCTLLYVAGRWGDVTGGSGLFQVENSPAPSDKGDPVSYTKQTNFDSHYHDCDEYWILYEGRGVAVTEGRRYPVAAGDCVVTGMGHHHDFPEVETPVRAFYLETTLKGQRRRGHLWNHLHGPAEPQSGRT